MLYSHWVMDLLRRAAGETVRALGINVPTALLVILSFGIKITFVESLAAPRVDSPTGSSLWLVESMAWLASVAIVFVLFLVWKFLKVERRDRSVRAHKSLVAESAASVDDRMKSFLCNSLSNPSFGVAKCYAFGSVVRSDPTRDVDIVIQFNSSKRRHVRSYRERLRSVENRFREFHGLELHVQTFLFYENAALDEFLSIAGEHEQII